MGQVAVGAGPGFAIGLIIGLLLGRRQMARRRHWSFTMHVGRDDTSTDHAAHQIPENERDDDQDSPRR